jgi:hypothetical protein
MCTDNMPSGSAYKLGDVLTARGGTTVEVKNTDAEGRLVMMDAIALANEDGVDTIIDIATLTGPRSWRSGRRWPPLIGNDPTTVARVKAAAAATDEPVWELPLEKKYRKQLDSDVADISNLGGPYAGATTAALFLAEFRRRDAVGAPRHRRHHAVEARTTPGGRRARPGSARACSSTWRGGSSRRVTVRPPAGSSPRVRSAPRQRSAPRGRPASVRVAAPSLRRIAETCTLAVLPLMKRPLADLPVAEALGDELEHLPFTGGELGGGQHVGVGRRCRRCRLGCGEAGAAAHALERQAGRRCDAQDPVAHRQHAAESATSSAAWSEAERPRGRRRPARPRPAAAARRRRGTRGPLVRRPPRRPRATRRRRCPASPRRLPRPPRRARPRRAPPTRCVGQYASRSSRPRNSGTDASTSADDASLTACGRARTAATTRARPTGTAGRSRRAASTARAGARGPRATRREVVVRERELGGDPPTPRRVCISTSMTAAIAAGRAVQRVACSVSPRHSSAQIRARSR